MWYICVCVCVSWHPTVSLLCWWIIEHILLNGKFCGVIVFTYLLGGFFAWCLYTHVRVWQLHMMETQVEWLKQRVFFSPPLGNRKYGYRQSRVYGFPPMPSRHWLLLCFFPAILGGRLLHCELQDVYFPDILGFFFFFFFFFFCSKTVVFFQSLLLRTYAFVSLVTAGSRGCCRESGKFDILSVTDALSKIRVLLIRKKVRIWGRPL